jgi:hypothetical protein
VADTFIAYLHPNEIPATFHKSLTDLYGWDASHHRRLGGYASVRCATGGVPEGRNQVAAEFLKSGDEWLFLIDADMGFRPDVLDELHAAADKDLRPIVGGLCFAQREVGHDGRNGFRVQALPTIYDFIEHPDGRHRFTGRAHYPANTVTMCAGTGAACLLIHRTVIEQVHAEYGPAWFDRTRGSDGSLLGEDISFFVRTGSLGIPCHVHTGVKLTHFKNVWLGDDEFWRQFSPPPATEPVTVIVPVLHRPDNVRPFMESLRASTGLAEAWFVCEPDDLLEWAEVEKHGARRLVHPGTFAQKVNAVIDQVTTPWVFLAGDDVRFRPGWLDHAEFIGRKYGAAVVGTNDLGSERVKNGEHATHLLIDTEYVREVGASWDGPGTVCHEGYRHWYVDDEIVTAAKERGVWQAALGSIVEHMHPMFGKAADDDVYTAGQAHAQQDRVTFQRRLKAHA